MKTSWLTGAILAAGIVASACGTEDPRKSSGGFGGGGGSGTGGGGSGTGGNAGGLDASPLSDAGNQSGPYFPFKVGNRWTYKVTDPASGAVTMKINIVEGMEVVGGKGPTATKNSFRTKTIKTEMTTTGTRTDWVVAWQGFEGSALVKYREQSYQAVNGATPVTVTGEVWWDKFKVRFDESSERVAVGATWTETYTEFEVKTGSVMTSKNDMDVWKVEALDEPCGVPNKPAMTCLKVRKSGTSIDAGKTYWFARGVGKVKELGMPPAGQTEELVEYQIAP